MTKKPLFLIACAGLATMFAQPAGATGKMTCEAGPQSGWRTEAQLVEALTKQGWQVRRTKVDGGCYEVYGTTPQGERVEAYFHPVSLEKLLVSQRGRVIFRAKGR